MHSRKDPHFYFAAPLFTPHERNYNAMIADRLSAVGTVFLPQRDGVLIPAAGRSVAEMERLVPQVFATDIAAIEDCDVVFAVLDGRTIDEGVAFELGYAYARSRRCVGYLTDSRQLLASGINPMILGGLETLLRNENELTDWLDALSRVP